MMSFFLLGLAVLIALALAFVLPALLRRPATPVADLAQDDARAANLRVLRDQMQALQAEHAAGTVDEAQFQLARTDIERRVLEEDTAAEAAASARSRQNTRAGRSAVVLGLFVPFFALLMYALLGTPQAVLQPSGAMAGGGEQAQPEFTQAQVEEMVTRLAQRMESKTTSEASDVEGWVMLARSYGVLQRYPEAARAYARAQALAPDDARILADHADVLAMAQGQRVNGEPQKLAERAVQLDPRNLKALALLGSAAFERQDYAQAQKFWTDALAVAPPGSPFAQGLESGLRDAQQAAAGRAGTGAGEAATTAAGAGAGASTGAVASGGGLAGAPATAANPATPSATAVAAAPGATAPGTPATPSAATGPSITGTVQLAPALAAKVQPTDTVFIFARAEQGPRMPLAILKRSAADLPLRFRLDDSQAMAPEFKLSGVQKVIVGARISRSGDALPRSGDLVGQSAAVEVGAQGLALTIDGVQP
jgi:cytochrome c-type biogenesis protein CcmH